MKIGIVTWAGCVRCIKECRMLAANGHELYLFTHFSPQIPSDIDVNDIFFHQTFYNSPETLFERIRGLDFLDLIHIHNEPSWMVHTAKKAGFKVVLDAHDLNIVRFGWKEALKMGGEDVNAIGESDGLIVPCDKYIDVIEEQGTLRIPTLELLSYANEGDFTENNNDLGGIVYQGSIYEPVPNHPYSYRLYDKVAKELLDMNIPFHIYPGRGYEKEMPFYQELGCTTYKTQDYRELLKQLGRHDWGFCGSPIKHRQWDNTFSNKLFDSIAAGIPSFIYQAEATEKRFGMRGIGPVVENLSDIEGYMLTSGIREDCREEIMDRRKKEWTMESQYDSLIDFYNKVLSG